LDGYKQFSLFDEKRKLWVFVLEPKIVVDS